MSAKPYLVTIQTGEDSEDRVDEVVVMTEKQAGELDDLLREVYDYGGGGIYFYNVMEIKFNTFETLTEEWGE